MDRLRNPPAPAVRWRGWGFNINPGNNMPATIKKITDHEVVAEAKKLVKVIDGLDERLDSLAESVKELKAEREQASSNLRKLLRNGNLPLMDDGENDE
jgi:uncharacterized protein with von Willebrand factor type A (vWA) domain